MLTALGLCAEMTQLGCGAARRFALREPLWTDTDTRPVPRRPAEYWSPLIWDAADQMVFRPVSRGLLLETTREAVNVNTLDEVPDSSWYTNRLARVTLTPEQIAQGPCRDVPVPEADGRWVVTAGKPNGWFPGFIVRGPDGRRYVLKADGGHQGEQPTAAEVIGSRLYWAAGYFAPCNRIVTVRRESVTIGPDAHYEDDAGERHEVDDRLIDRVFTRAMRMPDGRYRFGASLFVDGQPIGPFTYQGIRDDDPNDAIPHEDRRDLRGGRLMAAWLGHFDSREQNTLTTWIPTTDASGGGHVRHWMIDFGDCFGGIWTNDGMSRRLNYSGYFDVPHIAEDFLTLGLIRRPWDRARVAPATAWIFGYFRAEDFDPAGWRGGYPNPAFNHMTERDGAWMARIISRFSDEDLRAAVREAHFAMPEWEEYLVRTLAARRDRILARYLTRVSPLADVSADGDQVCAVDRALATRVYPRARYRAYLRAGRGLDRQGELAVIPAAGATVCVRLPPPPATGTDAYRVVEFDTDPEGRQHPGPLAVHLYDLRPSRGTRIVGLER